MATKNITTRLVQVSNVSPRATIEQIKVLFSFLGKICDAKMYPSGPPLGDDDDDTDVPPKVCYIMFAEMETVGVSLHLNQTSFIDRPLVVAPMHEEIMPDEAAAAAISTPIQIVPGQPASVMIKQIEQGGGIEVTPAPKPLLGERPVLSGMPANLNQPNSSLVNTVVTGPSGTVVNTHDPKLEAMGLPQYPPLPANIDPSKISEIRRTVYVGNLDVTAGVTAEALLQFFNQIGEVKFVRMAGDEHQATRFAFVEFSDHDSVAKALNYNGVIFFGRTLKIHHSNNAIVKPATHQPHKVQKEIDEAMKKVKEAASQMTAALGDEVTKDADGNVLTTVHKEGSVEKSDEKEKEKSKSSSRARSRSKSRERKKKRSRSRSKDRRRRRSGSRSRRSRSRDRKRSRERRRSRSRDGRGGGRGGYRNRSRDRRSRSRSRDKKSKKVNRRSPSPGGKARSRSPPPPPKRAGSPAGKKGRKTSRSPSPKKDKKRERSPRDKDKGKDKDKKKKQRKRSSSSSSSSSDEEPKKASKGDAAKKKGSSTSTPSRADADNTAADMDLDSD